MKTIVNKNIISILILLLLVFSSCSKTNEDFENKDYINIPDNHFETKLIEQGIDTDGIINHKISKSDAEAVSVLDLNLQANHGDIKSLKGIEGFINLKLLSAAGQELKEIDLSFNTKLDTLYLLGNYITSIDVSNNSNLILLDVMSNQLSAVIGLENLTNLKELELSFNYFEELTITNTTLEVLHMTHNDLTILNTDAAINLNHVLISSNKLESVDFSSSTSLETLLISGNQLENIDLTQNVLLTHFYSSSNSLTSLDLSNNSKLYDLRIDRNPNLTCIKIKENQYIPYRSISDYQEINVNCN